MEQIHETDIESVDMRMLIMITRGKTRDANNYKSNSRRVEMRNNVINATNSSHNMHKCKNRMQVNNVKK